jgi:hypothetical protein
LLCCLLMIFSPIILGEKKSWTKGFHPCFFNRLDAVLKWKKLRSMFLKNPW